MPLNTQYAPTKIAEYGSKDLNVSLQGVRFSAAPGVETINDFKIEEDHLIDGAHLIAIGSANGDSIRCQVIDKDNIFGLGADTVLGEYVKNWYMDPSNTKQLEYRSEYPAKIYGGLYLRMIYNSVGASPVDVVINYMLHRILW